jgi:uncharacterized repeat protein (TIGR01451 family)
MKTKILPLLLFTFSSTVFAADAPEFFKNGDGTVTHNPTGLILKMCTEGQTWDASFATCSGTAKAYSVDESKKLTSDFAGQKDWRLPTKEEMQALMEGIKFGLTSNANFTKSFFPFTGNTAYLSASYYFSAYTYYSSYDLGNFANGSYPIYVGFSSYSVKLIRGTQSLGALPTTTTATLTTDFLNNLDGTITHTKTGLTWQRCAVGQTWMDGYCDGAAKTFTHQNAVALTSDLGGNTDWRLPTFQEWRSIVDYPNGVNKYVFPDAPLNVFWSATNYTGGDKTKAFYVSFKPCVNGSYDCGGYGFYDVKTQPYMARLVRGTPLPGTITEFNSSNTSAPTPVILTSVDLSATLSQSSSRVKINENLTYTATVTNNGTGTANNSSLKFYLPPRNVSIVLMPSDCMTTGKSITCSLGNLAAGANASRAITVNYIKSGGASLSALVLTDSNDTNSANSVSRVVTAIKK